MNRQIVSLVLLLVALMNHALAANIQVCEHKKAKISCGSGLLYVITANYGRTDATTCAAGHKNQLKNLKCENDKTLEKLDATCQEKASCELFASNSVFGDPCVGTFKFLDVIYGCRQESVIVCEHKKQKIACPGKKIKILLADYGRNVKTTCAKGKPAKQVTKTDCGNAEKTVAKLDATCNDKESCELFASNSVFGDPCVGTFKFLDVDYMCV